MKILLVDLEFDYGQKSRGPNFIGRDGFFKSFVELGHAVTPFYFDKYLGQKHDPALQDLLLASIATNAPDLVFFTCMYQLEFDPKMLNDIKNMSTTVAWFGDDHWRFDSYTKQYASCFTHCVTTDPFSVPKYKSLQNTSVILSQWAAIDMPMPQDATSYKYDVSFIGMVHPYRKWFVRELAKRGLKVDTHGHGWPSGSVSSAEMHAIFGQSKINLNLSNSRNLDIRCLVSSPRYAISAFRTPKTASQIKARNFEIPFSGGFELTEYVPHLEKYFEIGKELSCFTNIDEAELLIRYFLNNEKEREVIRNKGQLRARSEHSYKKRLEQVLTEIAS